MGISESEAGEKRYSKPIRSPRLTWSDTSSKSTRPTKDFESCETVSIAESAQWRSRAMRQRTNLLRGIEDCSPARHRPA